MKQNKLFFLLNHLSSEERKQLKKVVISPFFNSNERLIRLYKVLYNKHPQLEHTEQFLVKVFQKVFPDEPYHLHKLQKLFSALSKIIEEYLLIVEQRENTNNRQRNLIRIFSKRNMQPLFLSATKALQKQLAKQSPKSIEYYENQIFLNEAIYFHPQKDKYDLKDESLDLLMESLDKYFALAKLKYGISLKSRERILNKPVKWQFMEMMDEADQHDFLKDNLVFQLYRQAFWLLSESEKVDFFEYEKLLFENLTELGEDAKVLFYSGLNYLNRQKDSGNSKFQRPYLHWYKTGLKHNLFVENQRIRSTTYGNIVFVGCREKEFEWTKNFMEEYASLLEEKHREDILTYHIGLWHFFQEDFEAVLSAYFNYQFSRAYIPKTRMVLVRALFELFWKDKSYYDVLVSNILAYKNFIIRDKLFVESRLKPHLNFLKILQKITKMLYDERPKESIFNYLNNAVAKEKILIGRSWLIEKGAQLLKIENF